MTNFLISAAALASTVALAAPAAAQWQQPNGYAYGYQNNYGQTRRLQVRVMQLRREIRQLDVRNILGHQEAIRLDAEARNLEYRVRQLGYNGIDPRERFRIEQRISRLEQMIRREASDGDRRFGRRGYGEDRYDRDDRYEDGRFDRDRDGRDDRYEDDGGRYPG